MFSHKAVTVLLHLLLILKPIGVPTWVQVQVGVPLRVFVLLETTQASEDVLAQILIFDAWGHDLLKVLLELNFSSYLDSVPETGHHFLRICGVLHFAEV